MEDGADGAPRGPWGAGGTPHYNHGMRYKSRNAPDSKQKDRKTCRPGEQADLCSCGLRALCCDQRLPWLRGVCNSSLAGWLINKLAIFPSSKHSRRSVLISFLIGVATQHRRRRVSSSPDGSQPYVSARISCSLLQHFFCRKLESGKPRLFYLRLCFCCLNFQGWPRWAIVASLARPVGASMELNEWRVCWTGHASREAALVVFKLLRLGSPGWLGRSCYSIAYCVFRERF